MHFYNNYFKYLLHILNFSHVILGILFIMSGVNFLEELPSFRGDKYSLNFHVIPKVCPIIGSIIILVSCFGCIAVFRKKNSWIIAYTHFMVLILILLIALCIFIAVVTSRPGLHKLIEEKIYYAYYSVPDIESWAFLDHIQNRFECCGLINYKDFGENHVIRHSCCGIDPDWYQKCEPAIYRKRPGCSKKILEFWLKNAYSLIYNAFGLIFVEVFAVFLAWTFEAGNRQKFRSQK